ncbi:MAG: pyridoxal phosphate-dependent class II aminotransferase [Peptococcaceae bacterium]|nr:pyridoxal phosphate-dependent class II aminotransferase [Peptococcaceae bacterium]
MKRDHGGIGTRKLLDFSVNINPLGPPACVAEMLGRALPFVTRYPSLDAGPAREAVAAHLGLDPGEVLVGNGATELISLLVRVLRPARVWVIEPCYSEYRGAAEACGIPVKGVPYRVLGSRITPVWGDLTPGPGDMVFAGYPNNPTGQFPDRKELKCRQRACPGVWWVFDESFLDFVDPAEAASLALPPQENVIAVHSLTKFYAVPGLRLGYLVAARGVVDKLLAAKDPWTVNGIAEHLAGPLLADRDYAERTRRFTEAERGRVVTFLQRLPGLRVFAAEANFLLCELPQGYTVKGLNAYLRSRGMVVRNASTFAGLSERHFRFGLRTSTENNRLLAALAEFIGNGK